MTAPAVTAADIRKFWFDEAGPAAWYRVSPDFDARMRRRFAACVEREAAVLRAGEHPWQDEAEDALALILLLDQFPRNIWRGSGKAFAFDALARQVARAMIGRGFDWAIAEEHRAFVYMPFMHSEALSDQDYCVELAAERLTLQGTHDHAVKHRDVIRRFGRFPYRNEALQRETTPEEADYLQSGGYAPGRIDSAKKT
ncbi:DUF924 family protein [Maricaulis salignorans]|uniref:Uncharacterized conserved protein, DUF924 family n=1 Tax=Maricaulis salignorans TaxID=144026 RepID=A0A1G9N8X0_9PROT|nr:DUF924 family protein [Maricaulis salignorans]SDL82966.1 Uncharacterized conserved protein, DUF924 family [Maricaulis salignorans]